jgi:transcription factor S
MMFCPKCGSLLVPKKNKKVLACSCGYTNKDKENIKLSEEIKNEDEIAVIDQHDDLKALPLTDAECPKCKNGKARFWTTQTRAADEAETKFLRCEKCSHVWREYD